MNYIDSDYNWDSFNDILSRYHIPFAADEAHGILTALLCFNFDDRVERWLQVLGDRTAGRENQAIVTDSVPEPLSEQDMAVFMEVHDTTRSQLEDPELGFNLLLPDDEDPLSQRLQALTSWCQGFLLGISLCGLKKIDQFPATSQEVITDLMEIAYNCEDVEDENEADEAAFFEILEHVRIGVLVLREDMVHLMHSINTNVSH